VSINSSGDITVSAAAALAETNYITVRAAYQGGTYAETLTIAKNINNSAARYLGTVSALITASATVRIIKGPVTGNVPARQGDYALAVAPVLARPFGSVFQWTGAAWAYRPPDTHMDLYSRCFRDGLDNPALANSVEWFGSVFARKIAALEAFVDELSAQVIRLRTGGVIHGGKYDAKGNIDPQAATGAKGFWLGANGELKAENGEFTGTVHATGGDFTGTVHAKDGDFTGYIKATGGEFTNGEIDCGVLKVLSSSIKIFEHFGPITGEDLANKISDELGYSRLALFTLYPKNGYYKYRSNYSTDTITVSINFIRIYRLPEVNGSRPRTVEINNIGVGGYPYVEIYFVIGSTGKTLRLSGLETSSDTPDEVYKISDGKGDYLLKVKG
jgi:hypothetical protein